MKIKTKLMLMALVSVLSSSLTACDNEDTTDISVSVESINTDNDEQTSFESLIESVLSTENITKSELVIEPSIEEETPVVVEVPLFTTYKTVTATTNVNIREEDVDGNILGVLPEGRSLRLLYVLENGWYEVEYYGKIGYVSGEYAIETLATDINRSIEKICYVKEDTNLTIPSLLSESGTEENVILPRLECLEVYDQIENKYLVKTNEYIGYVTIDEKIEELNGTFVVIDISNQELKLYYDNEVELTTPVVTGKPSTPSDQGLFEIYDIRGPRYLVGPDYKSYVDIMMKYNGGEGLHDAEHHKHENGFRHGWRNELEFGGETYLTDGSHGCINMLHEDVMKVSEYVDIGTKVLVKK